MLDQNDSFQKSWQAAGTKADIMNTVDFHLENRSIHTLGIETRQFETELGPLESPLIANITHALENLITYSSQRNDLNIHEEQYRNLKTFLAACNGAYRAELLSLLYPIFSIFIMDLLEMEQTALAFSFFNKYSCDHEEMHKKDLDIWLQLFNSCDNSSNSVNVSSSVVASTLTDLKNRKFSVALNGKVFGYFMQHLRNNNHSLLLQAINRNINIKITDESKNYESNIKLSKDYDGNESEVNSDIANDIEVKFLKECIEQVENTSKAKPSVTLYSFSNAFQGLSAVKFSPNSNFLCAGFEDSSIHLWSLSMKKLGASRHKEAMQPKQGSTSTESNSSESIVLRGHKGPVFAVQFLPEGTAVMSASEDATVRLWSVQSQMSLVEYKGHNYPVWDISTGCKGSYFVSASQDRTARLWSTEYAFPLRIFAGHNDSVDCVQFHPNGNYIASGSSDKTCRLWDLQSAEFVRVFVGHQAPVYTTTFSPDGTYLVSAGDDHRVIVWDVRNGKILQDLKGHLDTIYSTAFSKDGSFLVSGGLDNTIRVWNAEAIFKHGTDGQSASDSANYLIAAYSTKATSVLEMQFSQGNLLLAAGLLETR
eukprot:gene5269-5935_t